MGTAAYLFYLFMLLSETLPPVLKMPDPVIPCLHLLVLAALVLCVKRH